AATLLGRTCHDWETAAFEARQGLRICRRVIRDEEAYEEIQREIRARSEQFPNGISERQFFDILVGDLYKKPRACLRKRFALRWWQRLVKLHPEAPSLTDPRSWNCEVLDRWEHVFERVYREGRRKINQENRRPKRQKPDWEIKKDARLQCL